MYRFLPTGTLRIYRILRFWFRQLFYKLINHIECKKYQSLISSRINAISVAGNSGHVLDLGANVGHFSHAARRMGFDVTAVEPHPDALTYLRKRFRKDERVEIIAAAVGRNDATATLILHRDHNKNPLKSSISSSTIPDKFPETNDSIEVNQLGIDSLLEKYLKYFIVKIDIERSEMYLVDAIIKNAHKIEWLLVETHERFMRKSNLAKEYNLELTKLERFIEQSGRSQTWLTDWI